MKSIPYSASKYLDIHVLLESDEMQRLLAMLDPQCRFYLVGTILGPQEGIFTSEQFLEVYAEYVSDLREGRDPPEARHRRIFTVH